MRVIKEFLIREVRKPISGKLEEDIEWFCFCLGFCEKRDKKKRAVKIFNELLRATKENKALTADDIARRVNITRGAAIHHLNKFIKAGLVLHTNNVYELRMQNLTRTIEEMRKDIARTFLTLFEIAREIDNKLMLPRREGEYEV
ncbi:MAG: winged helix-turn-helix domain-containing protein [Candidatus Nanoarchaeia archaeon]|nr:helix-turn-helix domain-containing protein [Candidatus Jingweiarchaeum tengchongense]